MKTQYISDATPAFLNVPIISKKEELAGYDVAVLGFPWEGTVTWGQFTGCDLAPKAIRRASMRYSGFFPELDNTDIFAHLKIGDYRDVPVVPGEVELSFINLEKRIREILDAGVFPIVIGGDHGTSFPVVKALTDYASKKVGIIHFDAHYDNKDEFDGDPYARCCPLQRIAELNGVKTTSIVHVGIRGPRNNKAQAEYAQKIGATTFTSIDIKNQGIEAIIQKAYQIAAEGTDKIYVTVCSDALDVACNPGGPPDPNGLTSMELSLALYKLGLLGIDGFDLVEIYPPADPTNTASHVAAWAIQYLLVGIAQKKAALQAKVG